MPQLDVPGATLYYEIQGNGPILLCITGANGSVEFWAQFAEQMKRGFTVVTYDRRGFSRSHLSGWEAQDYDHRIERDADDVAALLDHVSAGKPAYVLGNSTGALVALEVLVRHPDSVQKVLVHEPPAHRLLPEYEYIAAGTKEIYQLYRRQGLPPALAAFSKAIKLNEHETAGLIASFDPRNSPYTFSNAVHWMEREVPYYPATEFDIEALGKAKDKLVLVNGEDTDKEAGHFKPNVILAERLSLEVKMLPGGHLGAVSHPEGFAKGVKRILDGE